MKTALFAAMAVISVAFVAFWLTAILSRTQRATPGWLDLGVGFITNVFDTLGIGSFATTSAFFKLWSMVRRRGDSRHSRLSATPRRSLLQAFIFIAVVQVDLATLDSDDRLVGSRCLDGSRNRQPAAPPQYPDRYGQRAVGPRPD